MFGFHKMYCYISWYILLVVLSFEVEPNKAQHPDEVYILIDSSAVFKCDGARSKTWIDKDDVFLADEKGNRVHYMRAPGEAQIRFRNISFSEPLRHVSAEISALLNVPLTEGPLGTILDFPYPIFPEPSVFNQKCDSHSGVVESHLNGKPRSFCRYCELCRRSPNNVEKQNVTFGYKYFHGLSGAKKEKKKEKHSKVFSCLDNGTYSMSRTVLLPGKAILHSQDYLGHYSGKLEVRLHMLSSEKPIQTATNFYKTTTKCYCCNPKFRWDITCIFSRIMGSCNEENCKSQHARQCIVGETLVGCYLAIFDYHLTTEWHEVRRFLAKKGVGKDPGPKPETSRLENLDHFPRQLRWEAVTWRPEKTIEELGRRDDGGKEKCINAMPERLKRTRTYCEQFWDSSMKFCCRWCPGECPENLITASSSSSDDGKESCLKSLPESMRKFCEKHWETGTIFCCPECPGKCLNFKYD